MSKFNEEVKSEGEMTTDEKIVFMVEHALKTQNATLLFRLSDLLSKRGHFESLYHEITGK